MKKREWLEAFVQESNRIEGYTYPVKARELSAHNAFLDGLPTVASLQGFVTGIAPGHVLRDREGLNVRVGQCVAPSGGEAVKDALKALLDALPSLTPHEAHCQYECLHPFTDGNGRSGRALWLWMMLQGSGVDRMQATGLGFLHTFYYQTLSARSERDTQ